MPSVLAAAIIEWTVQSWSDRASDDGEYNSALRRSLMQPFEFPVLGILAAGLVVFGFSRVMLSLTKTASVVAFVVVAGSVVVVAGVIAGAKRIGGEVIIAALMVGGIIVLTAGVIGAVHGERGFETHDADKGKGGESVANTANIVARFHLTADGARADASSTFPRSVPASVTFTNTRSEEYRLVVDVTDVISTSTGELTRRRRAASSTTVAGTEAAERRSMTPFVKDGQTVFLAVPGQQARDLHGTTPSRRPAARPHRRHDRGLVRRFPAAVRPDRQGVTVDPVPHAHGAEPVSAPDRRRGAGACARRLPAWAWCWWRPGVLDAARRRTSSSPRARNAAQDRQPGLRLRAGPDRGACSCSPSWPTWSGSSASARATKPRSRSRSTATPASRSCGRSRRPCCSPSSPCPR